MCAEINNEVKQTEMIIKGRQAVVVSRWQREDRVCSVSLVSISALFYIQRRKWKYIYTHLFHKYPFFVFHMGAVE